MQEIVLGPLSDLPDGQMRHYRVGDESILVCNIDGELHAMEGICPHRGAMLAQGQLHGSAVVCPWHGWAFDIKSGQGISNPVSCLKKFNISARESELVLSTEM